MLRRLRRFSILLLTVVGLSAVLIGLLVPKEAGTQGAVIATIVTLFGSSLFGASLPMMIEEVLGTETRDIWHYLTSNEKFDSAPDYIDTVVGVWHVYYLSKAEGQRIWKYAEYTFIKAEGGKSIGGFFNVTDQHGVDRKYVLEAGIRGDNLIVVCRASSGRENDGVEVVANATATHLSCHVGIQMLETWDGDNAVSLSIYSRKPLLPVPPATKADFTLLDNHLKRQMKSLNIVNLAPTR
jgi:hypothetical protein